MLEVLHRRMGKMGLTLHPDKTRLVDLRRPRSSKKSGKGSETLDFLGFTIYWKRTRRGNWILRMKTRKVSLRRAIQAVRDFCRSQRHRPLEEQHASLTKRLQGHYNYFGVTGNRQSMDSFLYQVKRIWQKWLRRRGQRKPINWERFASYLAAFPLPQPRIRVQIWGYSP